MSNISESLKVIKPSEEPVPVVVYGFASAHAWQVPRYLKSLGEKVLQYGYEDGANSPVRSKIFFYSDWSTGCECKGTLINTLVENVLRIREKRPILPVYFCYTFEGYGCNFEPNVRRILDPNATHLITPKELRAIYKMVHEIEDLEIQKAAKKTFQFKHVVERSAGYKLVDIPAPWETDKEQWEKLWREYRAAKKAGAASPSNPPKWASVVHRTLHQ